MQTSEIVVFIVMLLMAGGSIAISIFQFREKGFLFNNAYLYATKEQRKTMDKAPHYRQSAIIFLLIGAIFLINAVELAVQTGWLSYASIAVGVAAIVYAIVSSVRTETKKTRKKTPRS